MVLMLLDYIPAGYDYMRLYATQLFLRELSYQLSEQLSLFLVIFFFRLLFFIQKICFISKKCVCLYCHIYIKVVSLTAHNTVFSILIFYIWHTNKI